MSGRFSREAFFRPAEILRERQTIPAALFNRCRLLHAHCEAPHLFIPLRSMQFLAVVERQEIIFIDHQGGYAVQDEEGGRLIVLAWQFPQVELRDSLSKPVQMELVHYRQGVKALHRRIMGEFSKALACLSEKSADGDVELKQPLILPFRSPEE